MSFTIHPIHFYVPDVEAAQKWHTSTIEAIPGKRGKFEAADRPRVNLSFTHTETAVPGTKGRSLDQIGLEVKDLDIELTEGLNQVP